MVSLRVEADWSSTIQQAEVLPLSYCIVANPGSRLDISRRGTDWLDFLGSILNHSHSFLSLSRSSRLEGELLLQRLERVTLRRRIRRHERLPVP